MIRDKVLMIHYCKRPYVMLAYEMFGIIKDFLDKIITNTWMGDYSKLVLLGGIIINCEGNDTD